MSGEANFYFKPKLTNIKNLSKLFFACHPADFYDYFEIITDEILKVTNENHTGAVFAYINPDDEFDFENSKLDIENMQLLVIPITQNLLNTSNYVIEKIVPFALKKHIPVLPLMQESGLIDEYSRIDRFGDLQFLDKNCTDMTSIPYEVKLKDYLLSVLVGDELRKKVQAAFSSYIFLSYRKKDRKKAQEIMHLIHENDFCRDIAIWYDEFLSPGEDFTKSIQGAIKKSRLFAMVITPNIVEPDNYIILHEYPMANKAQKTILPLESEETKREELLRCYENLPLCTDVHNKDQLSKVLLQSLKIDKAAVNNDSPMHNYLIGLAYLMGIDVEINYEKGIALITKAAEAGLPEAVGKLSDIFFNGLGTKVDYKKSHFWSDKQVEIYKSMYPEYDFDGWLHLVKALYNKCSAYVATAEFNLIKQPAQEAIRYAQELIKEKDLPFLCLLLVILYMLLGDSERFIFANELSNEDEVLENTSKIIEIGIPYLKKAESIVDEYIERNPSDVPYTLQLLVYTAIFSSYDAINDNENCDIYYEKRLKIIKEKIPELADEIIIERKIRQKKAQTDFENKESFMDWLEFSLRVIIDYDITPKNAAACFNACFSVSGSLSILMPYLENNPQRIEVYKKFIEKSICCYEMLSEKQITNLIMSGYFNILQMGKKIELMLGNKKGSFIYEQKCLQVLREVYSRYKTLENKKKIQQSLSVLALSALILKLYDEAVEYGKERYHLAFSILKEDRQEESYINCVEATSFFADYFSEKNNTEKCLYFKEDACKQSEIIQRMFNSIKSLYCKAKQYMEYAEFLYFSKKNSEAAEAGKISKEIYCNLLLNRKSDFEGELYLQCYSDFCNLIRLMGDIYDALGDDEETKKYYLYYLDAIKSNIRLNYDTKDIYYKLGIIFLYQKEYSQALAYFKKYICSMPDMPTSRIELYRLSFARLSLADCTQNPEIEEIEKAKKGFEKLLEDDPDNEKYLYGYGLANNKLIELKRKRKK